MDMEHVQNRHDSLFPDLSKSFARLPQLQELSSRLQPTVINTSQKVTRFVKEHGAMLFYWASLIVSGCFYPHQFILGAVWGIFLKSIVTVTDENQWNVEKPAADQETSAAPRDQGEARTLNKQYLGSAALMLTGSYLFGGIVTFIAGWGTSDYVADLVGRHITLISN